MKVTITAGFISENASISHILKFCASTAGKIITFASYDNTQIAELLTPRLTSIDYDYGNFGRMLVNTAGKIIT